MASSFRLAVPLGDPAGIGPEVVLKALANPEIQPLHPYLTLVGDRHLFDQSYAALQAAGADLPELDVVPLLDVELPSGCREGITSGQGNRASGEASFQFLQAALDETVAGQFAGVVTAPIAKSAWAAAGHHYPGQTELLAERADTDRMGMMFVARSPHTGWTLRSLLATTHIPLRQVPAALTPELLLWKLNLLIRSLQQDFGIAQPRIAVSGLNPHSGEAGQLGLEERDWLTPWIEMVNNSVPDVELKGPVPPDTMWVAPGQAWYGIGSPTPQDAYIALYHDQGLIPVKLMAFDRAVNTTIGLPFVRTSPDHGTAFDIAGLGVADPTSMVAALQLGVELAQRRAREAASPV
ncbi:MAG: 4-hydroxythreonine-4-phosphate dehydrogenase PdxA [Cyanobacteria bacterium P01_A01_bin.135]